jgi:hypothetical protein
MSIKFDSLPVRATPSGVKSSLINESIIELGASIIKSMFKTVRVFVETPATTSFKTISTLTFNVPPILAKLVSQLTSEKMIFS